MKTKRKLGFAMLLLLVSLLFATSASYAWYSLANSVKADGMVLGSTAPDNLLIRTEGGDWSNSIVVNNIAGGKKIYPASSADGITFYALTDDGNAINGDMGGIYHDDYIDRLRFQAANTAVSPENDGYYTTYTLHIKTLGSESVEIYVANLIPKSSSNIDESIRIAIFMDSVSEENRIGIYDAGTQQNVHPVASITGTLATLLLSDPKSDMGESGPKITVPGGGTDYVVLIINLWIEGQNSKCINAVAGDTFNIDLKFDAVQP